MTGTDFAVPIRAELEDFEQRLHATVRADLGPVAEAMEQILDAGGKRLRPALVFLAAGLGHSTRMDDVHRAALAIEFIHNATLIHDDLIDGAPTRRGLRTIHETLGPNPAIIIGDYYFAKGANLMSQIGNTDIDAVLSQTVMTICFGEMLQLTSQRRYDQSLDEYYAKIERKTAVLLAASTYCGAVLAGLDEPQVEAMRRFGRLLGMSFQIADDVLDYLATEAEVGKPVGNDLKQGTVTLPLMLARQEPGADGRLDAVVTTNDGPLYVLHNATPTPNHWLILKLVGHKSNRDAIGAEVRVLTGGTTQIATVTTASSYLSSSDKRVHFGLGTETVVETIEIRWPSGIRQTLKNVRADQILQVDEPSGSAAGKKSSSAVR